MEGAAGPEIQARLQAILWRRLSPHCASFLLFQTLLFGRRSVVAEARCGHLNLIIKH